MIGVLATSLIIASLVCTAWAVGLVVVGRTAEGPVTLGLLALVELALLVQLVIGVVQLAITDREVSGVSFVGYLVGSLLILPVAAFWALAERNRWGTSVLIVGWLVVPVLIVRLNEIWAGGG